ncbi:PTS system protein [Klebsiella pneumoniae]|uniref:PTS system protein n=1 Tax=Klebsiella pneumoniae TaxID=573 RepID=A0A447RUV2_KLEPN|nr:PTS system protein [Klebsiella pneumoniae]
MLTGITEPIEFTFLFVSPLLWVIHATLTAASQAICDIFTVRPWGASGLIEFLIYNLPLPVSLNALAGLCPYRYRPVRRLLRDFPHPGGEAEPENAGPGR